MKKLFTLLLSIIPFLNVSAQDDFANELYFLTDQAPNSQDSYGNDVVVHGNLLFVTATFDDIQASNNGSVSLYSRANASAPWTFVKRILPGDIKINAFFGESIAVDGDYLVVGAEGWGPTQRPYTALCMYSIGMLAEPTTGAR